MKFAGGGKLIKRTDCVSELSPAELICGTRNGNLANTFASSGCDAATAGRFGRKETFPAVLRRDNRFKHSRRGNVGYLAASQQPLVFYHAKYGDGMQASDSPLPWLDESWQRGGQGL